MIIRTEFLQELRVKDKQELLDKDKGRSGKQEEENEKNHGYM